MKRKRTPRWFPPVAIAFAVSAAVFVPRWARQIGDKFPAKIRELHVQGAKALSSFDLRSMAGIGEGGPLFGRGSEEAARKLRQHPRIERVAVARDVTGKLVMRVAERKASALVNLDRLYYVDRSGRILDPADARSAEAANLIVITGPWRRSRGDEVKEGVAAGLTLRDALLGAGFPEKDLSELHLDPKLGWVLYRTAPSARALFGTDRFAEKAGRLARVVRDLAGKEGGVREIDLDYRDRVIVKTKRRG